MDTNYFRLKAEPYKTTVDGENQIEVLALPPIKFKDKMGRGGIIIDIRKTFGKYPAKILFQKVAHTSNTFVIAAMPDEEPEVVIEKVKKIKKNKNGNTK